MRTIVHAEALSYLAQHPAEPGSSVVTSMPDVSELPQLDLAGWKQWFAEAARAVLCWVPEDGVAIFYQSDVRRDGVWIDKGYLVQREAEAVGASLLFQTIVCREPTGSLNHGRATYSRMLCFARRPQAFARWVGPDVLADAGMMTWSKAMGVEACKLACTFLREATTTTRVVDPFCGHGTVLAVANAMGFDALGIDASARQCRFARRLRVPVALPEARAQ